MNNHSDMMATVAGVYDDGLSLIFDGQTAPTKKHYRCNTTAVFSAGMRVKVVKISGTLIVEYPVGSVGTGSGGGSGSTTASGGYYVPAVEQTDKDTMEISFSPSTTGMAAVPSKEIMLPSGYTPVRGTAYWTEKDIALIKSYVDEAILGGAW